METIVKKPSWEPQRTESATMQILRKYFEVAAGLKGLSAKFKVTFHAKIPIYTLPLKP